MLKTTISLLSVAIISAFGASELSTTREGLLASLDSSKTASITEVDTAQAVTPLDTSHLPTLQCQGSSCDLGSALRQAFAMNRH